MKKIKVVAVVGPTASGKTALAVEIAKRFDGEVVSADSMQIYKGMRIASAKPDEKEMQGIKHHLIDFRDLSDRYSVGLFVDEAKKIIYDISERGKLPVICGGTGLYVDSLINNINFSDFEYDENLRKELYDRLENEGVDALFEELKKIDGEYAEKIGKISSKRILRALELYYSSGIKMSEQLEKSTAEESPFDALYIGLKYADRQKLYERINLRVDKMLENRLVDEATEFYKTEKVETANQAIGIKELKNYLDGSESLAEAAEKIKLETRHYAKRQLTWFNRNKSINWIYPDENDDVCKTAFILTEKFLKGEKPND